MWYCWEEYPQRADCLRYNWYVCQEIGLNKISQKLVKEKVMKSNLKPDSLFHSFNLLKMCPNNLT
jgi:hypothetical protein